jgi:hypothetical protein
MSQSLASAKKRRAGIQPNDPVANSKQMSQNNIPGQGSNPNMQNGLTLPQVIQVVDTRLGILETFMKETKSNIFTQEKHVSFSNEIKVEGEGDLLGDVDKPSELQEIFDEFNERYEMLAHEIADIKDIVLSLQSYTMNVNKMLLQDRGISVSSTEKIIETNINNSLTSMILESIVDNRV